MLWHYAKNNQQLGPITTEELQHLLHSGVLTADTLVWQPSQTEWQPAYSLPEFQNVLAPYTPRVVPTYIPVPVRSPGFRCPYCQTELPPITRSRISNAGWMVFIILLVFTCALLCWIGFFLREDYRVCAGCGMNLG